MKISSLGKWVEESGEIKITELQGVDVRGRCSFCIKYGLDRVKEDLKQGDEFKRLP